MRQNSHCTKIYYIGEKRKQHQLAKEKREDRTIKKKEKEGFSIEDRKEVKMEEIRGKQSNS